MNDFKYALVEVMGRQKVVGEVSETTIAGAPMLRVDIPDTSRRKGFTRFFAPGALWGITPLISKEEMETLAEALDVVPVEGYSLRVSSPQLTEKIQPREFDLTNDLTYRSGAWDDDDPDGHAGDTGWINVATPDDDDEYLDDDEEELPAPNPLKSIVSVTRGETANSKSPMWRCITLDGERVNVFKHEKPERDTFHLFVEAGYGEVMESMKVDDVLAWKNCPISVTMSKKGDWWEVTRVYARGTNDKPDEPELGPKSKAAKWAKDLITHGNFVILDSEATGLDIDKSDEPVSIAVIDATGAALLDTLVKPTTDALEIDAGVSAVHGIRKENLKDAPSWEIVRPKLKQVLSDKVVVIYNAAFDMGVLRNAIGIQYIDWAKSYDCAMLQYAAFYGEWNARRRSFKWQSLEDACKQQGIEIDVPAHTAYGDCLRTLALIKKMAAAYEEKADEPKHPF